MPIDEKTHLSQKDFDLFTGRFNETAEELKKIYKTMTELKVNLDLKQNKLLPTWFGKGRNEYEKKYRLIVQRLTDINDDLEKIADTILEAEAEYISADMELAKALEGDQNRY